MWDIDAMDIPHHSKINALQQVIFGGQAQGPLIADLVSYSCALCHLLHSSSVILLLAVDRSHKESC
jgi:hypothetical protein